MESEKKILVIQPLPGIGDLFWFDGALQSLKAFYREPLYLMTKRQSQAHIIYQESPYVKEILWLERPGIHGGLFGLVRLAYELRSQKFSDVWIFHKSWRYRLACKLAGIQRVFSYPADKETMAKHPIDRATWLLQQHKVPLLKDPVFPVASQHKTFVQKKLASYKKPWVAIGIGGTEPSKKWRSEHWEDLAVWLSESKKMSVFLLGGPKEKEEAITMVAHIAEKGGEAAALTDFSLGESMAFLSQVAFFVGNDTGMMNGAVVQNKKTFGLFLNSPILNYRPSLKAITPEEGRDTVLLMEVQEVLKSIVG